MSQVTRNRLGNCKNEFQGDAVRILSICSAGLLRSPTIAKVLTKDFDNVNTRAVGTSEEFALIPLDEVHLKWADLVLCANEEVFWFVSEMLEELTFDRPLVNMGIPDQFSFADPKLESLIRLKLDQIRDLSADTAVFEFLPED